MSLGELVLKIIFGTVEMIVGKDNDCWSQALGPFDCLFHALPVILLIMLIVFIGLVVGVWYWQKRND